MLRGLCQKVRYGRNSLQLGLKLLDLGLPARGVGPLVVFINVQCLGSVFGNAVFALGIDLCEQLGRPVIFFGTGRQILHSQRAVGHDVFLALEKQHGQCCLSAHVAHLRRLLDQAVTLVLVLCDAFAVKIRTPEKMRARCRALGMQRGGEFDQLVEFFFFLQSHE